MSNSAVHEIEVRDLSFSYDGKPIFVGFSLHCRERRIVIKGPSGCGKTTLLKILFGSLEASNAAVLPHFKSSALVLQEDALFPWLTGRQNIRKFVGIDDAAIEAHPLFETLRSFIDRKTYQISYGQRRAIELFRAILYGPEMLYLDEPFNYLDDSRAAVFINAFVNLSNTKSRLVITTHRHDHSLDAASAVFSFSGEPPHSSLEQSA